MAFTQENDLINAIQSDTINENIDAANIASKINLEDKILNALHINIRSIKKNFDELIVFLESFQIKFCDIIILTECFQLESTANFNLDGYNTYYNNSDINRNDGVVIMVRSELNVEVNTIKLEFSGVSITKVNFVISNFTVGFNAVYRSPQTDANSFITDIESFIPTYLNNNLEIIIGDINIDLLDVESHTMNDYQATLHSYGFLSYINTITRPQSKTCLDHIFVKNNLKTENIKINSYVISYDMTDHDPVMLNISLPNNKKNITSQNTYKTITKIDMDALIKKFEAENWDNVYNENNPETATHNFYINYLNIVDTCKTIINKKIKEQKKIKPWITNGIINSIKTRDKLKKQLQKNTLLKKKIIIKISGTI